MGRVYVPLDPGPQNNFGGYTQAVVRVLCQWTNSSTYTVNAAQADAWPAPTHALVEPGAVNFDVTLTNGVNALWFTNTFTDNGSGPRVAEIRFESSGGARTNAGSLFLGDFRATWIH